MNKLTSALAAALAMAMTASTMAPVAAAPAFAPSVPSAGQDIVQVQSSRDRNNRGRFERRGGSAYYNNHRGYRERRPGYRYHQGFWFPPAAFIAGAIIGGALNNPAPAQRLSGRHVAWCSDRYRSYRTSDNTFQPYNGPRQQCRSPFG